MRVRSGRVALGAAAAVLASAGLAAAGADLIVSREDTRIVFGGCAVDEPLAEGRAAIKNIGDERATLPLGIIDRYTRSLVAVYVPEHLDMLDHGRDTTTLDPGDQQAIPFSIGIGKVKAGRLEQGEPLSVSDPAPISSLDEAEVMEYQRALAELEYYTADIDGIPGAGFRAAVEAFQERIGRERTGELTVGEAKQLAEVTGRTLSTTPPASSAGGSVRVTVYVVVDPYNLITEDDETNNMQVWTGVISCP